MRETPAANLPFLMNDAEGDGPKVRLQRVMADAGVAARRVCEELIEQGHVTVNGKLVRKLPVFVDPESDDIVVDGRRLPKPQRKLYLMLNKPAGTIVSTADEPELGRATVMDLIDHPSAPRLFPVGRLEFDTTGLLILTNDGDMANRLTHPRFRVPKTYQALVKGNVDDQTKTDIQTKIRAMAERETGVKIAAPAIEVIRREDGRTLLELTLEEGPTRHLRDAFEFLGMPIKKLTRVAVGGLQLKGLALGRWRELTRDEINMLRSAKPGKGPRKTAKGGPSFDGQQTSSRRRRPRPNQTASGDPRDNRRPRAPRSEHAPSDQGSRSRGPRPANRSPNRSSDRPPDRRDGASRPAPRPGAARRPGNRPPRGNR